jgi:hypothetical protein
VRGVFFGGSVARRALSLLLLSLGFVCLAAGAAHAQAFWGSKPMGMGGAFSAVANDVNTIQWNPAGLTNLTARKQMGFEFNYERHEFLFGDYDFLFPELTKRDSSEFGNPYFEDTSNAIDPKKKFSQDWYRVAIADGFTNPLISMGLSFTGLNFPSSTFKEGTDYSVDLALAGGFASIFSIGATGRFYDIDPEGPGRFDMDVGTLFNAVNIIKVGVVGRNLFGSDEPYRVRREVALSVAGYALQYAVVSVEATKVFDITDAPGTFNFAFGAEGIIAKMLSLRGGYNWDQVYRSRLYSVGAAFIDQRGTLAYTFQGDVDQVRNFAHSIELTIYLP